MALRSRPSSRAAGRNWFKPPEKNSYNMDVANSKNQEISEVNEERRLISASPHRTVRVQGTNPLAPDLSGGSCDGAAKDSAQNFRAAERFLGLCTETYQSRTLFTMHSSVDPLRSTRKGGGLQGYPGRGEMRRGERSSPEARDQTFPSRGASCPSPQRRGACRPFLRSPATRP